MSQVDPTKIQVQSNAVPVWETEVTFQDMMAEQLRHAPWLVLSAALHAVLFLILWAVIPVEEKKKEAKKAEMIQKVEEDVEEPPPPPPPETQPEETVDEIELTEQVITETENVETISEVNQKESAFDSNQWNSAVGMGGGAGGRYGGRGGKGGKRGGGKAYAEAIDAGLRWLKDHQDEDGKWDCDQFMKHDVEGEVCDGAGNAVHDVGVTGLALLAFLGDNNTLRAGPYKKVVKGGVKWLREQQQENGLFGTNTSHDFIYNHAIAAYAMCEAFGLSNYKLLKKTAQRGVNYLESHRNPYSVWRYQPRDNDNDTSVTGWAIMAYESGEFFGLQINKSALHLCETWLDQVTEPNGRHGYSKMGEKSSRKPGDHKVRFPVDQGESMTAVGLFCRFFMGQDPKEKPVMKKAADLILAKSPEWNEKKGCIDHYYWYYGTYALFQMGGRHWSTWQKKLNSAVVKTQQRDKAKKNLYGSWDPVGAWGEDGGRVYSTAILTLSLEAFYRYTKLIR